MLPRTVKDNTKISCEKSRIDRHTVLAVVNWSAEVLAGSYTHFVIKIACLLTKHRSSYEKRVPAFQIKLEFESVGLSGEGKTGVPREKPLGARERTNNKLNPHMAWTPGFERSHHCAIPCSLYSHKVGLFGISLNQRPV